jgi:DNA mismatch repair protein MutS2
MDARTLRVLEFPKITEMLAAEAATSLGAAHCRALRPRADAAWVGRRLEETEQARKLIGTLGAPPFGGLTDIRELLERARSASGLSETELLQVADAGACFNRLQAYYKGGEAKAPRLWAMAEKISDYAELVEAIRDVIDDQGQVRPDASPELEQLYRDMRRTEESLRSRLETIMRRELQRGTLQDPVIVQRAGRWCLSVQAAQQGRVQGILHDRSDSGVTVFMEPTETVDLGNRLREIEIAIRQEIARLLAELTAKVAGRGAEMKRDLGTATMLDMVTAKARLAESMGANEPALRTDGYLELRRARHPLLRGDVVANDVWVGRDFTTLVITGPNTGGKTVILKTVGLLTLMAQAGLHVPAGPTSQVNVFEHIFADIGDEQSIEQSLSTFSSHMTQIVRIINQVAARRGRADAEAAGDAPPYEALVLLDEIGAGTDPTEGSALARAVLNELHEAGCRTLATTHYNELKTFAYEQAGMENASVEFDVRTLKPTYRVLIGHAGASNALEIAQRLGLARRITQQARELLGEQGREVDEALRRMDQSRRKLDDERREAREQTVELERARKRHEKEIERLEEERRRVSQRGHERAREIVARAEEETRRIIAELQRQPKQSKTTQSLREQMAGLRGEVERAAEEFEAAAPQEVDAEPTAAGKAEAFRPGDRVFVRTAGAEGTIERVADGVAVVLVGKLNLEAPVGDLTPVPEVQVSEEAAALAARMRTKKALSAPTEIEVRGETVEEALHVLDKFLDDALLAGHRRLRIIHGKGTGVLRQAIHQWLKEHPSVKNYALAPMSEGGTGATDVEL